MQRRGGTGRTGMKTRDEDFVEHLFIASTHAYILIFTNTGRVYWLKVYEIPDVGAAGKGKHIGNLVACSRARPCAPCSRSAIWKKKASTSSSPRATAR